MSTEANARAFFSAPYFAVVGASSNPAKFGYKIFAWYAAHDLPATPINPGAPTITVEGGEYKTLSSLSALPYPKETAVSVITPPHATLKVVAEARALGIPALWLQPGTFDQGVLQAASAPAKPGDDKDTPIKDVVAGNGGRGSEGWCVLVDGERALRAVGKL